MQNKEKSPLEARDWFREIKSRFLSGEWFIYEGVTMGYEKPKSPDHYPLLKNESGKYVATVERVRDMGIEWKAHYLGSNTGGFMPLASIRFVKDERQLDPLGKDYVCPQCGPDPSGSFEHAKNFHTL